MASTLLPILASGSCSFVSVVLSMPATKFTSFLTENRPRSAIFCLRRSSPRKTTSSITEYLFTRYNSPEPSSIPTDAEKMPARQTTSKKLPGEMPGSLCVPMVPLVLLTPAAESNRHGGKTARCLVPRRDVVPRRGSRCTCQSKTLGYAHWPRRSHHIRRSVRKHMVSLSWAPRCRPASPVSVQPGANSASPESDRTTCVLSCRLAMS